MGDMLDRLRLLSLRDPPLDRSQVASVLERHGVEPWFLYAFDDWRKRWHVWSAIRWAIGNVPADGAVLETGCGCGWNLLWQAANGFTDLSGFDCDKAAVRAGNELAAAAGAPVTLWQDDGLCPKWLPGRAYRLILALNWTYHVPEFDLSEFLRRYAVFLVPGGELVIDVIDKAYDRHPNNCFLTSDWGRPQNERRPSEYLHRYGVSEVRDLADSSGYEVKVFFTRDGIIPRSVHVLRLR